MPSVEVRKRINLYLTLDFRFCFVNLGVEEKLQLHLFFCWTFEPTWGNQGRIPLQKKQSNFLKHHLLRQVRLFTLGLQNTCPLETWFLLTCLVIWDHGDILVSSVWGCVFCPWVAKFRPSPLCSHPISPPVPSRRGLHPFVSFLSFFAHIWRGLHPFILWAYPYRPRTGSLDKSPAVWKRSSTVSTGLLAWFWFSMRTCRFLIDVAFSFCDHFTADRRRRLAYPFLGIVDIYICLGTRIGIWFIHMDCFDIIHVYRCLRCDAGVLFGFFRGRCSCFCPC